MRERRCSVTSTENRKGFVQLSSATLLAIIIVGRGALGKLKLVPFYHCTVKSILSLASSSVS
jgi:hypothetical protein